MQMSVTQCKKRLSTLWFVGSAIIFFIILFQTFFGHYSGKAEEAWSWYLPTVLPTLSLMIGVMVAEALGGKSTDKKIDSFIYRISFYLSLFYFVIVFLTVIIQPFVANSAIIFLKQSNLWLAPIQGLVAASLGVFFVKTEQA